MPMEAYDGNGHFDSSRIAMSRKRSQEKAKPHQASRQQSRGFEAWLLLPLIGLLILWIIGYFVPGARTWGFHLAAFLPLWMAIALVCLALLSLFPGLADAVGSVAIIMAESIAAASPAKRRLMLAVVVATGTVGFFLLAMPYSFLGDSYFVVTEIYREVVTGERKYFFGHSLLGYPLYVWLSSALVKLLKLSELRRVFAVFGAFFGGVYLYALFAGAKAATDRAALRVALIVLLLGLGGVIFFFGYVEHYSGFFTSTAAYMIVLYAAVRNRTSLLPAMILALVCIAFHYISVVYLPGLLLAYAYRKMPDEDGSRIAKWVKIAWISGTAAAFSLYAIALAFRITPVFAVLIPFSSDVVSYTLLSGSHIEDVFNELLLISGISLPLGIGLLFRLRGRSPWSNPGVQVSATTALTLTLLMFVSSPFYGLSRDWDIHAVIGIAIAMTVFSLMSMEDARSRIRPGTVGVMLIWSLIGVSAWIVLNVTESSALKRYRTLLVLDEGIIHPDFSQYGYENLRKYYKVKGDLVNECGAVRRMIELRGYPWDFAKLPAIVDKDPSNPAIAGDVDAVLGLLETKTDDSLMFSGMQDAMKTDSTEYVADLWVRLLRHRNERFRDEAGLRRFMDRHPDLPQGYVTLQRVLMQSKYDERALRNFQALWARFGGMRRGARPVVSKFLATQIFGPMANVYMLGSRYDSAMVWLDKLYLIDSANVSVLNSLGQSCMHLGNNDAAERYLKTAMRIDPSFLRTYYNLALHYYASGTNTPEALRLITHFAAKTPDMKSREQAEELKRALQVRMAEGG
jgi:tetratricopeptide (TPR) repeat protein